MKKLSLFIVMIAFCGLNEAIGQWTTSGNNIYNTNTGYVGIGNSSPSTLLYVAKSMTEPTITVRNLGGAGGASFRMWDNASGADWKFKATTTGGFKIRDNAFSLDVFTIESNSAANALYIKSGGNIGIGTASPAASAAVDINSADKGFLIPRLTLIQIQSISAPDNGLQVFCTNSGKIYIYVATLGQWKEVAYATGVILPPFTCGIPVTIDHVAGTVAPVTKTVTYGTVTNIPGEPSKCWISSNLGADHQATAVNDATEESAGWYWQFNRMQGYKHTGSTLIPAWTITSISENSDWTSANDPCTLELGPGWRLPAQTEWSNVDAGGGWTDWNGPWNSALKMHASGFLNASDGALYYRGLGGYYWSGSQDNNLKGWYIALSNLFCSIYNDSKVSGLTCRCLRN